MVESYKKYVVIAAGVLEDFSRKYAPIASISWRQDGKRGLHIIDNLPRRFWSKDEAMTFALSEAKKWIDERV